MYISTKSVQNDILKINGISLIIVGAQVTECFTKYNCIQPPDASDFSMPGGQKYSLR